VPIVECSDERQQGGTRVGIVIGEVEQALGPAIERRQINTALRRSKPGEIGVGLLQCCLQQRVVIAPASPIERRLRCGGCEAAG